MASVSPTRSQTRLGQTQLGQTQLGHSALHPLLQRAMADTPPAAIAAPKQVSASSAAQSEPTGWKRFSGDAPLGALGEVPTNNGLGLLTFRVQELMVGPPATEWSAIEAAARTQLETFGVNTRAQIVDLQGAAHRELPEAVRDATAFFQENIEASGWGEVRVLETTVGAQLDDVLVVHARTFAGDGYLEVYDRDGAPLLSGTTERSRVDGWDETFGEAREVASLLAG